MKKLLPSLLFCLIFHSPFAQKLMNWSSFKWGHDTVILDGKKGYVPRSAIFLPIIFNNDPRHYYLQLDLGSDAKILLYSLPANVDKSKVCSKPAITNNAVNCYRVNDTLKGKFGNLPFTADSSTYMLMRNKNDTGTNYTIAMGNSPIIGTIGLNYFKGKKLMLDFPRQQFTFATDATVLPFTYRDSADYVRLHISNNRIFVPVTIGDTTYNTLFYDCGSSIFDLLISKKIWQKITGRNGDEKDNIHLSLTSWGTNTEAIGAHMKDKVKIGRYTYDAPLIFYSPAYADFKATFGCDGLFSNTSFYSKTILIDLIHNRLGILNEM
jgi:hypothetical protein